MNQPERPVMRLTHRWAWGAINLFLLLGWFVTVGPFFTAIGVTGGGRLSSLAILAYPVMLSLAALFYGRLDPAMTKINRGYVLSFAVTIWLALMIGLARGNSIRVIAFDLITFVNVLLAILIGRHDVAWRDIRPTVVVLTGASILLALRFTDSAVLTNRTILNAQAGSHFEGVLTLVPLLAFVSALERRNRWHFPLMLLTAGCLLVYLYFGRRAISVRVGIELLVIAVILPLIVGSRALMMKSFLISGVFLAALLVFFPFDVLKERYLGRYGLVDTIVKDNDRWQEARQMIDEMSVVELIVGRGLGGTFFNNQITSYATDDIEGERFGRIYPHVGAALPLLKGGLPFLLVYFVPLIWLISRLSGWRNLEPITLAAATSGIILMAFQFIEGTCTYSTPWVGFGIGLVMSRMRGNRPGSVPTSDRAPVIPRAQLRGATRRAVPYL